MDEQWRTIAGYKQSASYFLYERVTHNNKASGAGLNSQPNQSCFKIAYWYTACPKPSAPVVLLLHGFPSASWDWHQQWKPLAKNHHVLALDLLGFGISDKPKKYRYTLIEQAKIVEALLSYLQINRLHIIAHDYGVSVAQTLLANAQNDRVLDTQMVQQAPPHLSILSICFLNGGLFAESHRPLLTQKLLHSFLGPLMVRILSKASLKKSFTKIFAQQSPPSTEEIDTLWQLLCFNDGRYVLPQLLDYIKERSVYRDKWVKSMQTATFPIGFINGVHDPISGEHMLRQFRQLLPKYPHIGIDCGHYPQLEKSALVSELLLEFIERGTLPS